MDTGLPTVGHLIWRWLELHDLDAERIFSRQGLSAQDIQSQRRRVFVDNWDGIVAVAIEQIDDDCAGLKAARCWHPSDLGALGYAWLASSSLRTAFRRLERYITIVGQRADITTHETQHGFKVTLKANRADALLQAIFTDIVMSIIVDMCRFNFGPTLTPIALTLRREQPHCAAEYSSLYRCGIRFGANEDSFTLAPGDIDVALPTSQKMLANTHDHILIQELAVLRKGDFSTRCRAVILENLTTGQVSIERIAQAMHMSSRTLARRLESQGTNVKKLLDETRSELAERYLSDPANSISEVAFLLGFSQQSSLTRASNRWFGMPPLKYRTTHSIQK